MITALKSGRSTWRRPCAKPCDMALHAPKLTIGIEEEYLLVDEASRDLATEPPEAMLSQCEALLEGRVTPEFMRAQI